jgi:asparagine synthase (glutamine-hydrolysing)
MGYIAAALNKQGKDVSDTILKMLKAASKKPGLSYGIADYRTTDQNNTHEFTSHNYPILLGSKNVFPEKYPLEPIHQINYSLVFNGILLDTQDPDTLSAANTLNENPQKDLKKFMKNRTGTYTIVIVTRDKILAGIDHIGTIPLYYGESKEIIGLATNKKMLWCVNIDPIQLKPGKILKISQKKITTAQVKKLTKPKIIPSNKQILHKKLIRNIKDYAIKTNKATVAFSGGIDSILIAYYLNQNDVELNLIWTGIEKQPEQEIAQNAADNLGIKLHIETFTHEHIEETLEYIIKSIEEPSPVNTGIAFPFHWASKKTRELGNTTMYSGNGADELFAGYMKYLKKYLDGKDPSQDLFQDVINSYHQNFQRDYKTCLDQNIRLLLPFTHPELVEYGLSIPISQKLPNNRTEPRKKILRNLAIDLGIPEKLANRPKKAAQYSSGVNKTLRKISKKQTIKLTELVEKKYQKIKQEYKKQ